MGETVGALPDRNEKGTFAPGNPGGPGRPRKRTKDQAQAEKVCRVPGSTHAAAQVEVASVTAAPAEPSLNGHMDYRQLWDEIVTPQVFRDVLAKVILHAKAGSQWAAKMILEYSLGKPVQPVTTENTGELQIEWVNDWRADWKPADQTSTAAPGRADDPDGSSPSQVGVSGPKVA